MGHNGGPDWRAMIAGEDAKAVEALSRYKTPADFLKSHNELRAKLSERPTVSRLEDNATPEQVAEYRKGLGLPEIAKDAKPDDYMKAYKIEFPNGYKPSEVEKGLVGDYAKLAYEKGHSPREVNEAVGFFVKQQAAMDQAINKVAVDKQKEWQGALRDTLGSKEYDAQLSAANAWLAKQFDGREKDLADIMGAQLPGGGRIGDHPFFFEVITKQAMADGFTRDIEANSMESSGKSLEEQQRELEGLRRTDPKKYNEPGTQSKLDKIIGLRVSRGEIDEMGNPIRQRRSA